MKHYFDHTSMVTDPLSDEELLKALTSGDDQLVLEAGKGPNYLFVNLPHLAPTSNKFAWRIFLRWGDHPSRALALALSTDLVLGVYLEGDSDPIADVLLNEWTGRKLGVSRRHLLLRPTKTELHALDLESTNGSCLNGKRMLPQRAYPLNVNNLLTLGTLKIIVQGVRKVSLAAN